MPQSAGDLRLSKNCRLIQKEVRLQGEKGLEKGAEPSFPFVIGIQFVKKRSFFDKLKSPAQSGMPQSAGDFAIEWKEIYTPNRSKGGVYSSLALDFSCMNPLSSPNSSA